MKPSTLIDQEEGQPLLVDSPTPRRAATPKVLAAIAALCLTGAVAGSAAQRSYSGLSSTPLCDASVETTVVDDTLPVLVDAFNDGWSALATSIGLNPWYNVLDTTINVPKDPCDAICAAQASSCKKSYVTLDLTEMQGIEEFLLESIDASSMTVDTSDTSCPLPDGATCAFNASFPVVANLASGTEIKLTFQNLDFNCRCEVLGISGTGFTETPVSFPSLTCNTKGGAKATGTLSACFAGGCDGGGAAITQVKIKDFKISDSTDYGCSAEGSYWAEMQSYLLPEFKNDLYAAVNAPIQDALNTEFSDLLSDYDLSTCGNFTS